MAVLSVNGICKSFQGETILDNISFSINKNDKVAIVGDNGEGKTTLLKIITKELEADSGTVYYDVNGGIGYLSQQVIVNIENTLLEEMELSFTKLKKIEKDMEALVNKMNNDSSKELVDEYSKLHDLYENLGGYEYKYQIQQMLYKFGFDESYYNRKLSTFSGGERTRACFVKLLLNKPSLLLLDEPTNHLDLVMIEWLEKYLKSYSGTVLLVSHDQTFIDNIVNKIIELENHKATMYSGNYSFYVEQKQLHYEQQLKAFNVQEKEIKRYEMLIRKFKPKPTKTAFAQSLEKKLAKMDKIEKPNNNKKTIHAKFESNLEAYKVKMHICENLTFGYDNKPLMEPLNLTIRNTDKICIMGQNGSGKTTMLKCIMSNENLISGFNSDVRENLKYFYFDQTQQILNLDISLFDTIQNEFPLMSNTEVRSLLGRFLFTEDDVFKEVKLLSGGEKIRLIFALISLRNYDILYLDEPTNHLDFQTKRVVADILEDYPGTIVMVSHDRYFVNRIANRIIYLQNHKYIIEEGNYADFIKLHDISSSSFTPLVKKEKEETKVKEKAVKPINNNKEKAKIEKQIDALMNELEELNNQMNDNENNYDWVEYRTLAHKIKEKEEEIEQLMLKIDSLS
ncbi:MAG: ABC-F family ATP-binding cassette domain-containing protein [Candidatus Caccosoma sp.]|nr:ABC-F family ATP-binding cassette domain-containing protein [Candidatus Caccosoma sp.]